MLLLLRYTLFIGGLGVTMSMEARQPSPDRPNVIVILADDYGFNDIGYHARQHDSDMKTPFLDKLAAEGIKLENYYVQPICSPTRSQLLSGRYQIHTGLQHGVIAPPQPRGLPLDNIILPEQLRHCGYDTHMVGKWHLGFFKSEYLPWNRGFNSFFGFLNGGEDYYSHYKCYLDQCGVDMWSSETGPVNNTWGEYSAHLFARKAIEAIDKRNRKKPFFLYLAYQSVHSPMEVPENYIKPFQHIKNHKRKLYAGMVSALDESVMNVTTHLERAGLMNNTIIIFSTDNGGQTLAGGNNWPLRGRKNTLWEGGVRGVGFMHGKPLGKQGVTYNGLLHVSDWFPTILGVTNCPKLNSSLSLDGFNQWKNIVKQKPSLRKEILHNIDRMYSIPNSTNCFFTNTNLTKSETEKFDISIHAAIRSGPWKLLTGDPGYSQWVKPPESVMDQAEIVESSRVEGVQLFHIDTDPYERKNLALKFPDVVNYLLQRLSKYQASEVPQWCPAIDRMANPKYHGGFWGPWMDK